MADREKLARILAQNAEKSFVQRILQPENYPRLDLGDGNYATHMMAWTSADGKHYVYPTVLFDGKQLVQYEPDAAFEQAKKSGNVIAFDDPREADWFSKNYKQWWDQ
jgi:hypothetical protein